MIAVDTNLLVYSHRRDCEWNEGAHACISNLARGHFAIPWPCLYEFVAIVTHPRIYDPPTGLEQAIDQVEAWLEAPGLVLLSEHDSHWPSLALLLRSGRIVGPKVHDARIAALCIANRIDELWTADRDFSRFPGLRTRNPLTDPA
ncbi:MAG: PIN domain-containing protein [Polyangia bacterium]|jgi:toxin-antitoxin system PIN domain toxin|nr:PIN domain-containing protein [Polyangia bacterium]